MAEVCTTAVALAVATTHEQKGSNGLDTNDVRLDCSRGAALRERLIASTTTEFREEMGEAVSDDVPAFVVRTLTDPYQAVIAAECSALPIGRSLTGSL